MKPKTITQNAKEAKVIKTDKGERLICRIRKSQLVIKPEERFRQRLINHLIEKLRYDEENIGVEVPMTHHKKGESGRADIVVFDKPYKEDGAKPLIVIECKDPENDRQEISEYGIEQQVKKYTSVLKPVFQFITNDKETLGKDLRNDKLINYIPFLEEIVKKKIKYKKSKPYKWTRHPFPTSKNKKVRQQYEDKFICWHTQKEIVPNIIQMMDLLYNTASSFKPTTLSNQLKLKKDLGLRHSNYGYFGSKGLIGDYRCLVIEQPDGNSRTIGYSIYPQESYNGTYLMISVDDRKGHALELKLDKFIKVTAEPTYKIIHNLVMAVGHKGSAPSDLVYQEVKKMAPFLLDDGKVLLGTFDLTKNLKFQQKEVKDFILRTATYAFLRDDLRKKLQPNKK